MEAKKQIRSQYRQIRNSISEDVRIKKSKLIINTLTKNVIFKEATHILNFCSYQSEVMTDSLLDICQSTHKEIYYPKVIDDTMEFFRVNSLDELIYGYKGIREPQKKPEQIYIPASGQKILIIMPGLCFDEQGGRLGYGGGFYDRYLKRLQELSIQNFSYKGIALAYDEQVVLPGIIPMDIHDCSPDYLITDQRFVTIKNRTE